MTGQRQRPHGPGHVFVVNGLLQRLQWDATVIPTDRAFAVHRGWWGCWGGGDPAPLRPADWAATGAGRAADGSSIWFLDVARATSEDLIAAAREILDEVAAQAPHSTPRARRLLAIPVLGTRFGGFRGDRGRVVQELLRLSTDLARRTGVDVALVARDRSAYAAFQAVRRASAAAVSAHDSVEQRLGMLARNGQLALFLGAG